jgi:hypothetical protein
VCPDEITEICQTLKRSTVRNVLTQLRGENPPMIEDTGNMEDRSHNARQPRVLPRRQAVPSLRPSQQRGALASYRAGYPSGATPASDLKERDG